jgi:hypothetical protein
LFNNIIVTRGKGTSFIRHAQEIATFFIFFAGTQGLLNAERFLSDDGNTYIYSGSVVGRESATKIIQMTKKSK